MQVKTVIYKKNLVDKLEACQRRTLNKAGAYVRQEARSSMRSAKKPSKPGKPPHVHQFGYVKKLLYYKVEDKNLSVVAGPTLWNGTTGAGAKTVPQVLEEGGTFTKPKRKDRKPLEIGSYGPIELGRGRSVKTSDGKRVKAVYAKIKTPLQLERARRNQQILDTGRNANAGATVRIQARPFMKPAFRKVIAKTPDMWRDILTR